MGMQLGAHLLTVVDSGWLRMREGSVMPATLMAGSEPLQADAPRGLSPQPVQELLGLGQHVRVAARALQDMDRRGLHFLRCNLPHA